jgi:hypothetical protein
MSSLSFLINSSVDEALERFSYIFLMNTKEKNKEKSSSRIKNRGTGLEFQPDEMHSLIENHIASTKALVMSTTE